MASNCWSGRAVSRGMGRRSGADRPASVALTATGNGGSLGSRFSRLAAVCSCLTAGQVGQGPVRTIAVVSGLTYQDGRVGDCL